MLQSLLAERFHLVARREWKETNVYDLVLGRNGPKLTPSAGTPTGAPPDSVTPRLMIRATSSIRVAGDEYAEHGLPYFDGRERAVSHVCERSELHAVGCPATDHSWQRSDGVYGIQ